MHQTSRWSQDGDNKADGHDPLEWSRHGSFQFRPFERCNFFAELEENLAFGCTTYVIEYASNHPTSFTEETLSRVIVDSAGNNAFSVNAYPDQFSYSLVQCKEFRSKYPESATNPYGATYYLHKQSGSFVGGECTLGTVAHAAPTSRKPNTMNVANAVEYHTKM